MWILASHCHVNGDSHADIVATDPAQNRVLELLGNGQGSFAAAVPYTTGAVPTDVIVTDATGDGRANILTANFVGTVSLLRQEASGTLAAKVDISVGITPFALTVADMDQDGIADLVTANQYVDTVSVLKGLGDGAFSTQTEYSVRQQTGTYRPFAVTTGDLDAGGNAEVVVGNWLDYLRGSIESLLAIGGLKGNNPREQILARMTGTDSRAIADKSVGTSVVTQIGDKHPTRCCRFVHQFAPTTKNRDMLMTPARKARIIGKTAIPRGKVTRHCQRARQDSNLQPSDSKSQATMT